MTGEFIQNKKYYFVGSRTHVANIVENDVSHGDNVYLGYFIEYMGVPYVGDWLYDGKAVFEFGVISKGYYDQIVENIGLLSPSLDLPPH